VLLALDVPGWNVAFFLFAWYGGLVAADGLVHSRRGHSLLRGRRRELVAMMAASVPFWCLFELYNLRLQNWHYVFLPHGEVAQAAFATLAFATVLPACFVPAELVRTFGGLGRIRGRPLTVGPGLEAALVVFGLACVVLPLVAPRLFFPLVWGATLGIPAVINRRVGAQSLLADLEAGRPGRLLALLAGGLCAGFAWELLNLVARAGWIYTVPGLEGWKLGEMPLLGFLGFPALAVQAFSAWSLGSWLLRGGRHWERADAEQRHLRPGRRGRLGAMAGIVAVSVPLSLLTMDPAVQARRPLLADLEGLDAVDRVALTAAGLSTPERLCTAAVGRRDWLRPGAPEPARVAGLADRLEVPVAALERATRHACLSVHKGMGTEAASVLVEAGIGSVPELVGADVERLHRVLVEAGRARRDRRLGGLRPAQVRVWVASAGRKA